MGVLLISLKQFRVTFPFRLTFHLQLYVPKNVRGRTKHFCLHCTACKATIRHANVRLMLQSPGLITTTPCARITQTRSVIALRETMEGWMVLMCYYLQFRLDPNAVTGWSRSFKPAVTASGGGGGAAPAAARGGGGVGGGGGGGGVAEVMMRTKVTGGKINCTQKVHLVKQG
jgi:hypothetical protein